LKCWGKNSYGQLGDGTTNDTPSVVVIDPGTSYTQISAGEQHTCGITSAGVLKCWGSNLSSQLGDSAIAYASSSPVEIDIGTSYSKVSAGEYSTCGITTTGVLKCWGSNFQNQLGDWESLHYMPRPLLGATSP
jgi:alpha-tubulin suppressor-like RCC1 family protein